MKLLIFDLRIAPGLSMSSRFTRFWLGLLGVSLLLTACSNQDSKLRQQIVGTWSKEYGEMVFDPKGTFHSHWGLTNRVDFFGTWMATNGIIRMTTTNIDSRGFTNVPPVGRIESYEVIQIDALRLVTVFDGQTNSYVRK